MTVFVGEDNKPTLDELAHYGVLGMKWGKTRARATGSQIRAARRNLGRQASDIADQRDKVKSKAKGSEARAKEQKKLSDMKTDFLNNPDRVIAARLTRGEKAVAVILLTPAGAAAAIGATSAASRAIERRQDMNKLRGKK